MPSVYCLLNDFLIDNRLRSLNHKVKKREARIPQEFHTKLTEPLAEEHFRFQELLRSMDAVIVVFSGGVDSTLVARVAHHVLGERMLAQREQIVAHLCEPGYPHVTLDLLGYRIGSMNEMLPIINTGSG